MGVDHHEPVQFTTYLERNAEFPATDAKENVLEIPLIPFKQTYVLTCIDPRVEPGPNQQQFHHGFGELATRWVGGEAPVSIFRSVVSSPPPAGPDLRLVAASGSP
jgi:carbonic anhydrase